MVIARTDPVVQGSVAGRELLFPLSHDLPLILAAYPYYGQNLINLVAAAARDKGPRGFIDIGANVGDTAVMVRSRVEVPILAIEGDDVYAPLLAANLAGVPNIEIETSYVASAVTVAPVRVSRSTGTAALIPSGGAPSFFPRPLPDIIAAHPRFATSTVVKIDTDGADASIIVANREWFAQVQPIVFFEYDSASACRVGDEEPWRALSALALRPCALRPLPDARAQLRCRRLPG